MMKICIFTIFLSVLLIENSVGQTVEDVKEFLQFSYYNQCEGKDASNYTMIETINAKCDVSYATGTRQLLQATSNGTAVNSVVLLVESIIVTENIEVDVVCFFPSGPLEGKFMYTRSIFPHVQRHKKCSSVLAQSFLASTVVEFMISDHLDKEVFISHSGGYQIFKKIATTYCEGTQYIF